jgi:uncharacterized protein YoxC
MPEKKDDMEPRVAVLETDVATLKGQTSQQWAKLDKIQEDVGEVKEHLAKQNGAIPHMQTDMTELKTMLGSLTEKHHSDEVSSAKLNTKNKIYLGIAAVVGGALIGAAVKGWLPILLKALFGIAILL